MQEVKTFIGSGDGVYGLAAEKAVSRAEVEANYWLKDQASTGMVVDVLNMSTSIAVDQGRGSVTYVLVMLVSIRQATPASY